MFRIAPTPSGHLHLGNAFSFLLTRKLADRSSQPLLLRIDDLDSDRKRPEFVNDVFEVLEWLGIGWEVGPRDIDDFESRWSQRHRLPKYQAAIEKLLSRGVVYACACSRKELVLEAVHGSCTCKSKTSSALDTDSALRIDFEEGLRISINDVHAGERKISLADSVGHFVVRRKDGLPAYQVASLVDDLDFGVSTVVRGEDLIGSTAAQLHLAELLQAHSFKEIRFIHHQLLLDDSGKKLSKSEGALSLKHLISTGVRKEEIESMFKSGFSTFGV